MSFELLIPKIVKQSNTAYTSAAGIAGRAEAATTRHPAPRLHRGHATQSQVGEVSEDDIQDMG